MLLIAFGSVIGIYECEDQMPMKVNEAIMRLSNKKKGS